MVSVWCVVRVSEGTSGGMMHIGLVSWPGHWLLPRMSPHPFLCILPNGSGNRGHHLFWNAGPAWNQGFHLLHIPFCHPILLVGGGLFSVGEGVQEGRFKLGDVKNGVDPLELLREADCNRVCARGTYYLKWSQVLLCQFPWRLGCAEELFFYIYLVTNPEGWWWHPLAICCLLVAFLSLCDRHLQLWVQLVQVHHVTLSLGWQWQG